MLILVLLLILDKTEIEPSAGCNPRMGKVKQIIINVIPRLVGHAYHIPGSAVGARCGCEWDLL